MRLHYPFPILKKIKLNNMKIITIRSINPDLDELRGIRKHLRKIKKDANPEHLFLIGFLKERKRELEKKHPTY